MKTRFQLLIIPTIGFAIVIGSYFLGKASHVNSEPDNHKNSHAEPSITAFKSPAVQNSDTASQRKQERTAQIQSPKYWNGQFEKQKMIVEKIYGSFLVELGLDSKEIRQVISLLTEKSLIPARISADNYQKGLTQANDEYMASIKIAEEPMEKELCNFLGEDKYKQLNHYKNTYGVRMTLNKILADDLDSFTDEQINLFIEVLTDARRQSPSRITPTGHIIECKLFLDKIAEFLTPEELNKVAKSFQYEIARQEARNKTLLESKYLKVTQ